MLEIKNKKQSVEIMKKLNLNYFPLQVFDKKDLDGIKNFISNNPSKEYVVRTTDDVKGMFFYAESYAKIKNLLVFFKKNITLSVSYRPLQKHIVLVGDIKVEKTEDEVLVNLTASSNTEIDNRKVYDEAEFNFKQEDVKSDNLWSINGFAEILEYIIDNNLFDLVVEFTVYDIPVGRNNQNVLISEIRGQY